MAMYELEIVDEEAFLNWKEDVTDAYPGKGQALFQVNYFTKNSVLLEVKFNYLLQVNQWLTWLQEAESEDEEGDD